MTSIHELLIAFGLGLLVGLQREWAQKRIAGARTFPLISALGAVCAMLSQELGGWVLAAGLVSLAAALVAGMALESKRAGSQTGVTTEVAALTMFVIGAVVVVNSVAIALVGAGGMAVLLQWKTPLRRLVDAATESDLRAITQLIVIALVILPILPNETYGPYEVLNPFKIWLMVSLIVSISLAAYVAAKLMGARKGALIGGALGGLISSTATTFSYASRARSDPQSAQSAAIVILIASTIVFARVLFEIAVVTPSVFAQAAPPLALMAIFMTLLCLALNRRSKQAPPPRPDPEAPTHFWAALLFGGLYAVVLLGVAAAKEHFGDTGLYSVAALSGLTDMDAITLSSAHMVDSGRVEAKTGWRLILVGAMSNLLFKGAVAGFIGGRVLLRRLFGPFGLSVGFGILLLVFWP